MVARSSNNIERLYEGINKIILLMQDFTEIKNLAFIIKSCRLKPYNVLHCKTNRASYKKIPTYEMQEWWIDEFRCSLKIKKNKDINIIYNDLTFDASYSKCTDLYYGLSLVNTIKISKLVYLILGKDEDFNKNCFIISLLGIDNYFRTFLLFDEEWYKISTLYIGIRGITNIVNNLNIINYKEFLYDKKSNMPCVNKKVWLSSLPVRKEFIKVVENKCGVDVSILEF